VLLLYDAGFVISPKMLDMMAIYQTFRWNSFRNVYRRRGSIIWGNEFWGIDLVMILIGT
jgi:hypothetical protein